MRTTSSACILSLVLGITGNARAKEPAPSTAPVENLLGQILEDEAGDEAAKRIAVGLIFVGGGIALLPVGISALEGDGFSSLAGILVLGMSASLLIPGIVTLAVQSDLEDLADDHAHAIRKGARDEVFAQRLAQIAAGAESRRYLAGGLLTISAASTLISALGEEDKLVPGVAGGVSLALGLYFLLVPSNAEDALERYRALEPLDDGAGIRWTPTFGATGDSFALGVTGVF